MLKHQCIDYSWHVLPDRNDVGEEHHKTKQVTKPGSDEALQCNHDDREHHLCQEEGLGEAVQLQVKHPHL